MDQEVPNPGEWPVDPQQAQDILDDRIWIDGCFDFFHHGHAGVMLQARQLGNELYVGIHSDEAILEHKGPTVMSLQERVAAADACRWVTKSIPHAPYVTMLPWISHYGCRFVVHGDDITSDSGGEDCYRFVKEAGRFKVVKRTPGISTTDLVGRMLLCTKNHFIRSLSQTLRGSEGSGTPQDRSELAQAMRARLQSYATDDTGNAPGVDVLTYGDVTEPGHSSSDSFPTLIKGKQPMAGQRIVYVDGGFDLFSSGHIEFLKSVVNIEIAKAKSRGWYGDEQTAQRKLQHGKDFEPAYVVAGIHNDRVINEKKGLNYPIMNIYERGLCVVQCKYVHAVVFGAPFEPTAAYLKSLPCGLPDVVYHGPTAFMPLEQDPYVEAKHLGIFEEVPGHAFQDVNAGQIVERITRSRALFEERQRKKGVKSEIEAVARQRELEMEKAQ